MGARAFIPLTLAGALILSIAPAFPAAAEEPTTPVLVDPTTPVVDPATDLTPGRSRRPDPDPDRPGRRRSDPDPRARRRRVVQPVVKPKPRGTEAQQIIRIARRQLGRPWRLRRQRPRAFDCSGLVIYAFKHAGDGRAVANGHLRSARALYRWYKSHGLASRSNPKVGDLVIWGGGTHVGIYVGHGKAISTLMRGVKIHRVHAVTASFTAYLHTGMWKKPVR